MHPDALQVHGLSNDFLRDKPLFKSMAPEFLAFIGDAPLVIHNAQFDIGFINVELERIGRPPLPQERLVDTLMLARRKHPAGPNSLDALCKRYGIDNSKRTKHGALMDSWLLAGVYVELLGERQATLELARGSAMAASQSMTVARSMQRARPRPEPLPSRLSAADEAAHAKLVESLGDKAIWKKVMAGA